MSDAAMDALRARVVETHGEERVLAIEKLVEAKVDAMSFEELMLEQTVERIYAEIVAELG